MTGYRTYLAAALIGYLRRPRLSRLARFFQRSKNRRRRHRFGRSHGPYARGHHDASRKDHGTAAQHPLALFPPA